MEQDPAVGPLSGLRVLDLAGGVLPYCGLVLSLYGAEVVLVEGPGDAARREDVQWLAYNAGRKSVLLDLAGARSRETLAALAAAADVIVEGTLDGSVGALAAVPAGKIRARITPFGAGGPRSEWKGSELIAQASGGLLYISGNDELPPACLGVPLASCAAGAQAAIAIMAALRMHRAGAANLEIDVSMQEAVMNLLLKVQSQAYYNNSADRRAGARGSDKRRQFFRCADGFLTWNFWTGTGWGRKNYPILGWMNEEGEGLELAKVPWEELSLQTLDVQQLRAWEGEVAAFLAKHTKQRITKEALDRNILLAVVQDMNDVLRDEQHAVRGALAPFTLPGGKTVQAMGRPYLATSFQPRLASRAPALGEDTVEVVRSWTAGPAAGSPMAQRPFGRQGSARRPLEGVRVLDFSWAIAGPATTKMLGMLGADVVKLETRARPDAARMTAPYPAGRVTFNGSAVFANHSASKRAMAIDLHQPAARPLIMRLAAEADIIVENFTPGVLERLDYSYDVFRGVNPDVIMLSLSLQGQTGPHSRHSGLGNHLQAISGLDSITGFPDGPPGGPNQVLPDFNGVLWGIISSLMAIEHRDRTGEGMFIDLSQYEAMLMALQPSLFEAQISGNVPPRRGNADRYWAPQGVYPAAGDDLWVAITIQDDAQWRTLLALLPEAAAGPLRPYASVATRLANQAAIDAALGGWTGGFDADELAVHLQAAGVPAAAVATGPMLIRDPQVVAREHYHLVDHERMGPGGKAFVDGPAYRIPGLDLNLLPAPLYGADSFDALHEWLGVEAEEFADLLAAGVILAE